MQRGEMTHTKNLILFDMDEVLVKAEDLQPIPDGPIQDGYFPAFARQVAETFPDHLARAGIEADTGLLNTWYDYKKSVIEEHGPQDFAGLDRIWRKDVQNSKREQFDPVNFFRIRLNLNKK